MVGIAELTTEDIEVGVLAIRRALTSGSPDETRWALVRTYEIVRESLQSPRDTRFIELFVAQGLMTSLLRLTELTAGIPNSGIPAAPEYAGVINSVGRSVFEIGVDIPAAAGTQEEDAAIMDTYENCVNPTQLSPVEIVVWVCIMATDYVRFPKGVAMTAFITCGGIPHFMELLAEPEHMSLRTIEYILWALGNLTVASSAVCSVLYNAGLVPAAVRVLRAAFALPAGTKHRRNALCNAIWAVSMLQAWEDPAPGLTQWASLQELAHLMPALAALDDAEVNTYVCRTLCFFTAAMCADNVRSDAARPAFENFDAAASSEGDAQTTAAADDLSALISAEADLIKASGPYVLDTPTPTLALCSAATAANERAAIAAGVRAVKCAPGSVRRVALVFRHLTRLATGRCALARVLEGGARAGMTHDDAVDAVIAGAYVISDALEAISSLLGLGLEQAWSLSVELPHMGVRGVFQWLAAPNGLLTRGSWPALRVRVASMRLLSENGLMPDLTKQDEYAYESAHAAQPLEQQQAHGTNVMILFGTAVAALEQQQAEDHHPGRALESAAAAWTFAKAHGLLTSAISRIPYW